MDALAVFVFEGQDLDVYPSIAAAEEGTEVYDLHVLEYYDADARVLRATAEGYNVRLSPTTERRPQELRERLAGYLQQPPLHLDPRFADDPAMTAQWLLTIDRIIKMRRSLRWYFPGRSRPKDNRERP